MSTFLDFCKDLPSINFEAGEFVIEEGKMEGRLLFLQSGEIEIFKSGNLINTVVLPGTVIGEVSVLLGRPHSASVHAKTPCSFYTADNPDLFLSDNPELALKIARTLAGRLYSVTNQLADRLSTDDPGQLSDMFKSLYEGGK